MHRDDGNLITADGLHADLTQRVIGAAIEVHRVLGPGLLESVYERALVHELLTRGIAVARQCEVPISYKGVDLGCGFRIDLLVEETVVIEIKSVDRLTSVHEAQLLSYLRLSNRQVGILINFNVRLLKDGIRRRVLS